MIIMKGVDKSLRRLEKKDIPFMLEWMHDKTVVKNLQADFANRTLEDCKKFIENSINNENINLAIVNNNDEYMGTVSLKHIGDTSAEFAIVVRKNAMGKGYSIYALQEIVRYAFDNIKLKKVYWCVSPENIRALRFYDKHGFSKMDNSYLSFPGYSLDQIKSYIWYYIEC